MHVAFLHDVEQANLNFAGEIGEFVDGENGAIGAGQQAVVHGEFAGKFVASAGGFDGIDVSDEVGDGDVGRGQFFYVAVVGREPGNGRGVGLLGDEVAAAAADGDVRVVVDFASGDVRHLRIEQRGQGAQDAAFCLSAEPEQDEVVAGEDGVDDLRDDGVVVADDAGKDWAAFAEPRHEVLAQLVFDVPGSEALFSEGTLAQLA